MPNGISTDIAIKYNIPPGKKISAILRGLVIDMSTESLSSDSNSEQLFNYIDKVGIEYLVEKGEKTQK